MNPYELACFVLMAAAIVSVICFPFRENSDCDKTVPYVIVINSDGSKRRCHQCKWCPEGYGFPMKCEGETVALENLNTECVPCVAGVNFSTGDSIQCQPCQPQVCEDGFETVGKCEVGGDRRRCPCKKYEYYDGFRNACLPCSCENMSNETRKTCDDLGFSADKKCSDIVTTPTETTGEINRTSSGTTDTSAHERGNVDLTNVVVACVVVLVFVAPLVVYCCCIARRYKQLKMVHPHLALCSKTSFCPIFFFKTTTLSPPPDQADTYLFNASLRQSESQENFNLLAKQRAMECKKKKLKFLDMNSEVCGKICDLLKRNVTTGMGYPTLAGRMGFSAGKVKTFELSGKPCEELFDCWSNMDMKENNVLKLRSLVAGMERDDIVTLLDKELEKVECHCSTCSAC